MPAQSAAGPSDTSMPDDLDTLYRRPGFMLRRAHQIAVSVFTGEMGALGTTPTQFGILHILGDRPNLDQITLARVLGLDRSTTGMVVGTLEAAGLLARVVHHEDKRRRVLALTPAGRARLTELAAPSARAVEALLAPLSAEERPVLLALLAKLTDALNETTRVPLVRPGRGDGADGSRLGG